jgi:hypothetical protein
VCIGSTLESLKGSYYLEDIGVDGMIILKLILNKHSGVAWAGFVWLRIATSDAPREHDSEPSDAIKWG